MDPVLLTSLPNAEARRLLATGVPVYLPVNPVEYHGPHLSLANDGLVSQGMIRAVHERLHGGRRDAPLVRVPDLEVGCGTTPGPGTRHQPFDHVRASVMEACGALAHLGAKAVVLVTFHGDPLHNLAIDAGVRWLRGRGIRALAPMHLLLRRMTRGEFDVLDPVLALVPDPADRALVAAEPAWDFHAGFLETSLALHLAPATVSKAYRDVPPCPPLQPIPALRTLARAAGLAGFPDTAGELRFAASALGWLAMRPFPGYTGRPALASPEVGAALAAVLADGWAEASRAVLVDGAEPPPPVFPWFESLTLGGRIGYTPARVPAMP
jgi:creatinine amidohydrolase